MDGKFCLDGKFCHDGKFYLNEESEHSRNFNGFDIRRNNEVQSTVTC